MRNKQQFLSDLATLIKHADDILRADLLSESLRTKYGIESQTNFILARLENDIQSNHNNSAQLQDTYNIFKEAKINIFTWIDRMSSHQEIKDFFCKLRRCLSWDDVMLLEQDFIVMVNDAELKLPNSMSVDDLNEYFYYYSFLIFLSNVGVYAVIDPLYNELGTKDNNKRIKFDFFNNGMPLTCIPMAESLLSDSDKNELLHKESLPIFNEMVKKCEESFYEQGSLKSSILSDSRFLAIIVSATRTELSSKRMNKVKFRRMFREHIRLTELIALSLYEADINIDNDDYIKLATFKENYFNKINSAQSIDEAMDIFENNFDEFERLSKNVKKGILEFGDEMLTIVGMLDLNLIAPTKTIGLYMQLNEYRVLTHHMFKIRTLASHAFEERLSYEIELVTCLFTILEEKIKELKTNTDSNNRVSIKSVNKKIVKYKKIYDFKTLNKLAEDAGFKKVRQNGDHGIFKSIDGGTVVIPQGRSIGKGLSCKIQKNIIEAS